MELAVRIVVFFAVLSCLYAAEANPPRIGGKIPSRFLQVVCLVTIITGSTLLAYSTSGWLPGVAPEIGNHVVLQPFLLAVWSLLWSGAVTALISRWQRHFTLLEKQLQVVLPAVILLAADGMAAALPVFLSILFFFVTGLMMAGIQSRLRYAPIPHFLQGLPIQIVSLGLIFLGTSFFRGVFFETLF